MSECEACAPHLVPETHGQRTHELLAKALYREKCQTDRAYSAECREQNKDQELADLYDFLERADTAPWGRWVDELRVWQEAHRAKTAATAPPAEPVERCAQCGEPDGNLCIDSGASKVTYHAGPMSGPDLDIHPFVRPVTKAKAA